MTVIEFKNVTKYFKIYQNRSYSIKEKFLDKVLRRNKLQVTRVNVLKDASFKIEKGETIGIIGENGAGKSTSLKLISNILKPNEGEIFVKGKISSLLEIGVGFQPDLSGRENVYLYGSILGLKKQEIDKKYDEIVKFAELEAFINTPVKNYSSGMYMRLAFSVAVSVEPDILLVDEVLAVGDANFQKKCLEKIDSFKRQGKTIVFVSHDMSTVRKICDRVFFVKRGGAVLEGTPEQMIGLYLKLFYSNEQNRLALDQSIENKQNLEITTDFSIEMHEAHENKDIERKGSRAMEITKLYFSNNQGHIRNVFSTGEDIKLNIELKKNKNVSSLVFGFKIYSEEGWYLGYHNCKQDGIIVTDLKETNLISVTIKNNPFLKSKYYLSAEVLDEDCTEVYDSREKYYWFAVTENNRTEEGKINLQCDWHL